MASVKYMNCFLLLCGLILQGNGARILMIFPPPSPSHTILGNSLATKLSSKGHDVTLLCPFANKDNGNYKRIVVQGVAEIFEDEKKKMLTGEEKSPMEQFSRFNYLSRMMLEATLENNNTKELLASKATFDLVILDAFFNEALLGFAHYYNATTVVFCPIGPSIFINHYFNNPAPPSYITEIMFNYPEKLNFLQRFTNTFATLAMTIYNEYVHLPTQDHILHAYFPGAPPVKKLMNDVSLILLNSHASLNTPKPIVPNMIEIGGFHINEPKQLPEDLKEYLDKAENGCIFFSMGSNIKSTFLPKKTLQIFLNVFQKLPYRILWKFEDKMDMVPSNVLLRKWLPQNDILAHPNIKLFITHGGFLSMSEAVYHGVPIVGIPVFGDQESNMANAVKLAIGKALKLKNLNEENLLETITEVLDNDRYSINAKERSKVMKDRPVKPLDNAVFWVEYALRHKNSKHFQTGAVYLEWYQLMMLDVIAFASTLIFTALILSYWIFKKCCLAKCFRSKSKVTKKKKDKTL